MPASSRRWSSSRARACSPAAFGLSSGLYYAPGSYSKTAEVIAMARATAPFGGVYSSHIRDESDYTIGVVAAVQEVIDIAEQGGVIGVVSHMKALGPASWGLSKTLIDHIDAARAARRAGVRRSISVRSQRHRHCRRADSALGAGRRPRRDDEADHRRAAQRDSRRGEDQHRAPRRRRHADDQPLHGGSVIRRTAPVGAGREGRRARPRNTRCSCSRRATRAWCRSTCPRATSKASCASRGR